MGEELTVDLLPQPLPLDLAHMLRDIPYKAFLTPIALPPKYLPQRARLHKVLVRDFRREGDRLVVVDGLCLRCLRFWCCRMPIRMPIRCSAVTLTPQTDMETLAKRHRPDRTPHIIRISPIIRPEIHRPIPLRRTVDGRLGCVRRQGLVVDT